jgi:hypothetical protein
MLTTTKNTIVRVRASGASAFFDCSKVWSDCKMSFYKIVEVDEHGDTDESMTAAEALERDKSAFAGLHHEMGDVAQQWVTLRVVRHVMGELRDMLKSSLDEVRTAGQSELPESE